MRFAHWLVASLSITGCGGTVRLRETTPITVTASAAEPEEDAPAKPKRVEVKADRIDVSEAIYFEHSSSRISSASNDLLDEIAKVIIRHPELKKVRIEGHTDSVGNSALNLRLSKKRAAAVVKYLVDAGVEDERVVGEGYGQTKPVAKNTTEDGRAKNRRVVFVIVERSGATKPEPDAEPGDDEEGDP